jgi:hypothetical protein
MDIPNEVLLWFTSVLPGKTFISHDSCFPHPFQFNIYQLSYNSTVIQSKILKTLKINPFKNHPEGLHWPALTPEEL